MEDHIDLRLKSEGLTIIGLKISFNFLVIVGSSDEIGVAVNFATLYHGQWWTA